MAKQRKGIFREICDEAAHQLRGFPRASSSTSSAASVARPSISSAAAGARSSPGRSSGVQEDTAAERMSTLVGIGFSYHFLIMIAGESRPVS